MADRIADDAAYINARLKEIQAERESAIKGTPEVAPVAPAGTDEHYRNYGGFKKPDGTPYQSYEG